MNNLWAIHLVEYIKTEQDTQGRDLWVDYNNTEANTEAVLISFQIEGTVRLQIALSCF